VDHHRRGEQVALVVDTREQTAELNAAIRERLVRAGRVDDARVVTTRAGQRIGAGDRVATRRNDRHLGVANRDTWTVTAIGRHGQLTVPPADATPGQVTPVVGTPAAVGERVLPADYIAQHVELAYASTAHGVPGDTVAAAHVVIGEHTGAASAYVGMTRGRTANTAHLVATDPAEAREQWITAFGRDRLDLGPGHAAELAAREATRYAQPRPFEQALADLYQAWTTEHRCLARLTLATSRRDLLRKLVGLEAGHADRLAALNANYRQTAIDAQHAQQRADASAAVVTTEADRLRDRLLTAWDAQRDTAHQAARTVLDGPGRFGLRRAAVARASGQLTAWADIWRPHLPTMPSDPHRIADLAAAADDRPRLQAAFDGRARRHAESSHPEHTRMTARHRRRTGGPRPRPIRPGSRPADSRRAGLPASVRPAGPSTRLHSWPTPNGMSPPPNSSSPPPGRASNS
jgi:hypothetical protein